MTDAPKMPRPWFRAETFNKPICTLWERPIRSVDVLHEGERRLGAFVLPPFQRPPVWTEAQKVRFLESVWSALPLGAYVYNRSVDMNAPTDGWLLDGQQRITAILDYVADAFPVFGYRYSELTVPERRGFEFRPITALETTIDDVAQLAEIYDRLAYGGTPHEPKKEG